MSGRNVHPAKFKKRVAPVALKDNLTVESDQLFEHNNKRSSIFSGNMTADPNKDMSITYNHLNLPKKIGDIEILYDATGRKWAMEYPDGTTRYYLGGIEFKDDEFESFNFADGRIFAETLSSGASEGGNVARELVAEYHHKDHLGNIRVAFSDRNGDRLVQLLDDNQGNLSEVNQILDYYPFGLQHPGQCAPVVDVENRYQYNGKEWIDEIGLYDYGARWYDPSIARWGAVDPLAEKYSELTPYHYTANNPIRYVDYDGKDYGVRINHEDQTITIEAHFIVDGNQDAGAIQKSLDFWNNKSGEFEYIVGEGDEAVSYTVNFVLTSDEATAGETSEGTIDAPANPINIISDDSPIFAERTERRGSETVTIKPQGGSNGYSLAVKESQRSSDRFISHEMGHNLGMNHTSSGRMNETGSGNKINKTNVGEALGYGGVGSRRKGQTTRAKVTVSSSGEAPLGFNSGKVQRAKRKRD